MRKGFTLLELLVVVVVIAILAAVGLPKLLSVGEKAKMSEGIQMLNAYRGALMNYQTLNPGETPSSVADLDFEYAGNKWFNKPSNTSFPIVVTPTSDGPDNLTSLSINENGTITCTATDSKLCNIAGLD